MAENNKIAIVVTAKDLASGVLNDVDKNLGEIEKSGDRSSRAMGALKAAVGAIAVKQIVDFGLETAEASAKAKDLAIGFKTNFGDVEQGLNRLRAASNDTIRDADLMLAANKAALLGVTNSTEDLAGLLETARLRGKQMGLTTTQAFDDIVTGIGRGSPLILDNLGIKIPEAFKEMTADMSEAERTQALLNLAIEDGANLAQQMGGSVNFASDRFEQFGVKVDRIKGKIGDALLPILEGAVDALDDLLWRITTVEQNIAKVRQGETAASEVRNTTINRLRDVVMGGGIDRNLFDVLQKQIAAGSQSATNEALTIIQNFQAGASPEEIARSTANELQNYQWSSSQGVFAPV